jgi:hypothetical protein
VGLVSVAPSATPTPAATPISPIATTTTASAASAAFGLRARFIHVNGASANLGTVQSGDGFLSILVAGHLDETEAAGASGVAVGHDADTIDLPMRLKKLPQFLFVGVEAEVSYKNILHASASAMSCRKCKLSSAELAGRVGRS